MSPHGTLSRYMNEKCRCDDCKRARREYQRRVRKTRARSHGATGYLNHGCRCDECATAGVRLNRVKYYSRLGTNPRRHGRNGYVNHGCRCDICVEAGRSYQRERAS